MLCTGIESNFQAALSRTRNFALYPFAMDS